MWAILFEGGLGLLACLIGWCCGYWPLSTLHFTSDGILWGILGTLPLFSGLLLIDRYPFGPFASLRRVVDKLLLPMFRGFKIWQLLVVALLAGLGEEIFFRGLLQGGLFVWLQPHVAEYLALAISLGLASLLFGLLHPITRTYAILCMLVGVYLGGIWIVTDNLLAPITVHALYDFLALVYLLRSNRDSAQT